MGEAYIMKYLIENKFVKVDKYMKQLFKNLSKIIFSFSLTIF